MKIAIVVVTIFLSGGAYAENWVTSTSRLIAQPGAKAQQQFRKREVDSLEKSCKVYQDRKGRANHQSIPMKAVNKLPSYGADLSQTSVSGFSSGGFMTTQLQVTFSSQFVGAGIVAGGPYYCAGSNSSAKTVEDYMKTAATICMMMPNNNEPNAQFLDKKAQDFAAAGKIDSLDHLKNQKIYIFSGASDKIIKTTVVDQVKQFYQLVGVSDNNIKYVDYINAGHAFITNNDNNVACPLTECPFINDCYFSQAQEILRQIYGHLNPPAATDKLSSQPMAFNQQEFIDSDKTSMSHVAYVYVPKACETTQCKIHVAFHGCLQGATELGDTYYTKTRYNEIADTNNIIVLYPQAQKSARMPINPAGCWDYWGYSSPDPNNPNFYTKDAPQMKAIMKMIQRLGEPRTSHTK